ncbi:hypothetical protein GW891_01995 [bacterium]|nr:hypothetical protein [bacterium]
MIHSKFQSCNSKELFVFNNDLILGSVKSGVIVAIRVSEFTSFQGSQFNSVTFQSILEDFFIELFDNIFHSKTFDCKLFHQTIKVS